MLPNFIGIGAPRAGTTWLFGRLREHPEIFMAEVKEANFFTAHTIAGRIKEYEDHFVGGDNAVAVGEISVRYLTSNLAPERIKHYMPDVRLFVSLRNPIDQIYSHYWHLHRQNFHQWDRTKVPRSFEEALETYEDTLLEPARYHKHLQKWLTIFDRSQLHIIFYDDVVGQPGNVLSELYSFIGVDSSFVPASIHERGASARRGTSPRGHLQGRMHSWLHDKLNRQVYYPLKQVIGVRAAARIKDKLRIRETMERLFLQPGYPEISSDMRELLRKHLANEIEQVASMTNRDLSHWQ